MNKFIFALCLAQGKWDHSEMAKCEETHVFEDVRALALLRMTKCARTGGAQGKRSPWGLQRPICKSLKCECFIGTPVVVLKKQPAPPLPLTTEQQGPCAPREEGSLGYIPGPSWSRQWKVPDYWRDKGFPGGSAVKMLPAMQETQVPSLSWEDPLEKGMATHSSILAWRIPMDRGAWWATVHGVAKPNRTEQLTLSLSGLLVNLSKFKYECL